MNALAIAIALLAGAQGTDNLSEGTKTGSRLDPATRVTTNADTSARDAAMLRFIECAVARRETKLRTLIDTRSEQTYQKSLDSLSDVQRCSLDAYVSQDASVISFGSDRGTLRGFVAEAFVEKDLGRAEQLAALPAQRVYLRDWYEMTGRARPIDEMAACVADTNPAGVIALLRTGIGTKAEKSAVAAIAPSLGACLATGYKLNANRLGLRTALAEGLYHRTFDAPATAAEGAN